MCLLTRLQSLSIRAGFEDRRERVVIGGDAGVEHAGEEGEGLRRGVGAGVATGEGVEEEGRRVRDCVEQVVGIREGGGSGIGCELGDEFCEEREVSLEVGFDGQGMELL